MDKPKKATTFQEIELNHILAKENGNSKPNFYSLHPGQNRLTPTQKDNNNINNISLPFDAALTLPRRKAFVKLFAKV